MKGLDAVIVVLSLAGIMVSMLALREHYNTETSPCSIDDVWDCGIVNHSPYAVLYGVPVAAIGIMGYALLAVLAGRLRLLTALGALAGFVFASYLTHIEAHILGVWCVYCVASQGIITLVVLLAWISVIARWKLNRRVTAEVPGESAGEITPGATPREQSAVQSSRR